MHQCADVGYEQHPVTTIDPRTVWLVQAARHCAAVWQAESARAFVGHGMAQTGNTVYRFRDGVFSGRAQKPVRAFAVPSAMEGVRLLGFLSLEGGLLAMSTRFRPGACAVLWKAGVREKDAFLVTSTVLGWSLTEPEPSPWANPALPEQAAGRPKPVAPFIARPAPPSMTRIHASAFGGGHEAAAGRG
jgi:hypothetical protein